MLSCSVGERPSLADRAAVQCYLPTNSPAGLITLRGGEGNQRGRERRKKEEREREREGERERERERKKHLKTFSELAASARGCRGGH